MCVNECVSGVYTHILSLSACLAAPVLLCSSHTTSELDGITLPQILIHTNTHKNTRAQTGRLSQPRHVLSEHIRRHAERSTLTHTNGATGRAAVKLLRSHTHTHTHTHTHSVSLARVFLSVPVRPETIPRHKKSSSPSLSVPRSGPYGAAVPKVPGVSAAVKQTLQPVKPSSNTAYLLSNSGALWFPSQLTVSYEPFVSAGEGKQRSEFGRKI